jgi:anti-anti-sigma regulatory factor
VTFIDSSGLSALLRIARAANEEGVPFSLVVSDQVRSVLAHAGLLERLILGSPTPATV